MVDRFHIERLRDEDTQAYAEGSRDIAGILRREALRRQVSPRGDASKFQDLLRHWDLDLSGAAQALSHSEVVDILLSISDNKTPGTTGVRGRL